MNYTYYTYPQQREGDQLFYIEFHQWEGRPKIFKIMQRHFFESEDLHPLKEGHGWNLWEGEVGKDNTFQLNTEKYLKFLIDALNEKNLNDKKKETLHI